MKSGLPKSMDLMGHIKRRDDMQRVGKVVGHRDPALWGLGTGM